MGGARLPSQPLPREGQLLCFRCVPGSCSVSGHQTHTAAQDYTVTRVSHTDTAMGSTPSGGPAAAGGRWLIPVAPCVQNIPRVQEALSGLAQGLPRPAEARPFVGNRMDRAAGRAGQGPQGGEEGVFVLMGTDSSVPGAGAQAGD